MLKYGFLRFKGEYDRLISFYSKKTKKSKNAAKIISKLNEMKFDDVPTIMWVEKYIKDYRKYKTYKYL